MVMAPPCLALGSSVSSAVAGGMASISASADVARDKARSRFMVSSLSLWLVSSEFYARIDERGDDVGDEVAEHDSQGGDQRDAHDDGNVDALARLPGELADARPAEHAFDDHDAAHEHADVEADHRDDGQDGV